MTHAEKVLALLSDGKPHTHHEGYALGVILHSRVADLRKRGYRIDCWTEKHDGERVSVYRLGGLESAAPTPDGEKTAGDRGLVATGAHGASGAADSSPSPAANLPSGRRTPHTCGDCGRTYWNLFAHLEECSGATGTAPTAWPPALAGDAGSIPAASTQLTLDA